MTNAEVLKNIERQVDEHGFNGALHISCEEYGAIKSALEYRTPKKPDYEGDGYDENSELIYDTWICPCCNHAYEVDYDDYYFCPNCGQAIDRT